MELRIPEQATGAIARFLHRVFSVRRAAFPRDFEHLNRAVESSRYILDLQDNWDDAGAPAYSSEVWGRAIRFLRSLAELAHRTQDIVIEPPRILPGPDGSIDLHWKTDGFELLINIPVEAGMPASYYGDNKLGNMPIKNQCAVEKPDRKLAAWMSLFE